MTVTEVAKSSTSASRLASAVSNVTAEHLAYLGLALLAAILRFTDLGLAPLNPREAEQALVVWDQWQAGAASIVPGSPAYFTLTGLISQVVGFSDAVMRAVPAVFGFALVLTPWFLRQRTGRLGALIAALLLTFSPVQTAIARTAGGQSIALFAGMMVFVAWLRYQERGGQKWLTILAAALAIGCASAPLFYAIVFTITVAWLVQQFVGPALVRDDDGRRAALVRPSRSELQWFLIVGLSMLFLLATTFFLAPRGLGSTVDQFEGWFRQFRYVASAYIMTGPFAVLLRYEIGLVIIGLPAAIWAAVKEKPFPLFLVYWSLAALLLMLLQPGTMANVLLLTLPGYLLIGCFFNKALTRASASWWWAFGLAVLFSGAIVYLHLARYARLSGLQGVPNPTYHLLIVVLALIVTLIVTLLTFNWDRAAVIKGLLTGFLALVLLFSWGSAWWLSRAAMNDTRERWTSAGTDADIHLLRETIEELSWRASNSVNGVELISAVDTPALRWYLRDFDKATFATSLPASTSSPVLITPLEYPARLEDGYIGAEYSHTHPDTIHRLERIDALRWWLFHQSPVPISAEYLVLWLRSDLSGAIP